MTEKDILISAVVPAYNEEGNVRPLFDEIRDEFERICKGREDGGKWEIIFVDDGSTDRTAEVLESIPEVTLISFEENAGQTAAMDAGFHHASGRYVVSLDADGQNDPKDISGMITYLEENDLDVVCGVRKKRKDTFLKRFFSRGARLLRKVIMNDTITDSGCTLRVYRREVLRDFDICGDQHRFIPALLSLRGARVGEMPVNHRQRQSGVTKYNFTRVFRGLADMFSIRFFREKSGRVNYLFFALSMILFAAFIAGLLAAAFTMAAGEEYMMVSLVTVAMLMLSAVLFLLSFINEIRHTSAEKTYVIKTIREGINEDTCS